MSERFWIVWLPARGLPQKRHGTAIQAVDEAMRVASNEKQSVYVCECIGVAKPQTPPIVWEDWREVTP